MFRAKLFILVLHTKHMMSLWSTMHYSYVRAVIWKPLEAAWPSEILCLKRSATAGDSVVAWSMSIRVSKWCHVLCQCLSSANWRESMESISMRLMWYRTTFSEVFAGFQCKKPTVLMLNLASYPSQICWRSSFKVCEGTNQKCWSDVMHGYCLRNARFLFVFHTV